MTYHLLEYTLHLTQIWIKKEFEKNLNDDTAGYLRTKIASRIDIRHTPKLRFIYDNSIEYGNNIEQKIKEIHEKDSE